MKMYGSLLNKNKKKKNVIFVFNFAVCCDGPILKRLSLVITVGIKLFSTWRYSLSVLYTFLLQTKYDDEQDFLLQFHDVT